MNDTDTKDERQAPAWPDMGEGWYVTVGRRGHDLLTITDTSYSGCADPEPDESLIVGAAQHLLAFVGYGLPSSDFAPDDSVPQAEYGYTEAFYQISALLGIGAQDATPETVFKTQMLPKLRVLLITNADALTHEYRKGFIDGQISMRQDIEDEAGRQPLTAEQSVAWLRNLPIPPAEAVRQPLPPAFNIAELIEAERRSYDECGEADRDNAIDCLARLERRIEKAAAAARQPLTCLWTKDFDGPFDTSCGNAFQFTDDCIEENNFKFCCYCGLAIEADNIPGAQE